MYTHTHNLVRDHKIYSQQHESKNQITQESKGEKHCLFMSLDILMLYNSKGDFSHFVNVTNDSDEKLNK